jgi:hypothetical protein
MNVHATLKCFESDIPLDVEPPLASYIELKRSRLTGKLRFILSIFGGLGIVKDFLEIGIGDEKRWRSIIQQEA